MQPLLAGPRASLTTEVVERSIDLSRGAKVRWSVVVLDSADKPKAGETIRVESGSVTWSYRPPDRVTGNDTAAAAVRRRAELIVVGPTSVPLGLRRYRIQIDFLSTGGVWVPWLQGVFVPTIPGCSYDGTMLRYQLKLADKTYRYLSWPLDAPVTIPAGTNVVEWVIDDLASRFGETSFAISASTVTLTDAKTFDPSTTATWLDVYNSLLETAGYDQLTADEAGNPASQPLAAIVAKGSEQTYGPGAGKIKIEGDVQPLIDRLPNVVRFVARQGPSLAEEGNGQRTVVNQSTGPASIDQVGEQPPLVVEVEAEDQAELDAIAAVDAQRYFAGGGQRFVGRVGLNPRHSDRDVVTLDHPQLGLSGEWLVTSWTLPLKPITSEEAVLMPIELEQRVSVTAA